MASTELPGTPDEPPPQTTTPEADAPVARPDSDANVEPVAQAPDLGPPTLTTEARFDLAHSILQKATAGALAITGALGVITAINRDTAFGDGRCSTGGDPVFGDWGCRGLSTTHGISGAISLVLFTATETTAFVMPNDPYLEGGPVRQRITQTLRWVNIGLFAVQPVLGLIGAFPETLGVNAGSRADVSEGLRTAHIILGVTTALSYLTVTALQW